MMQKNDVAAALYTQLLLAAILLTRLPLPRLAKQHFSHGNKAVWAYPLVGLLVGTLAALAGTTALGLGLPPVAAAGLALAVLMLSTGAMHEDGLADLFDGFWGGQTPARRLEIMRDSQIGSYGVLALLLVTGLRWSALAALLPTGLAPLIAAATLSRAMMPLLMLTLPHARRDGLSHSVGQPGAGAVALALLIGVLMAMLCTGWVGFLASLAAILTTAAIGILAHRRIGGQTGDVLGAAQQLSETAILLILLIFLG